MINLRIGKTLPLKGGTLDQSHFLPGMMATDQGIFIFGCGKMNLDSIKTREEAGIAPDGYRDYQEFKKMLEFAVNDGKMDEKVAVWILEIYSYIDANIKEIQIALTNQDEDFDEIEKMIKEHRHDMTKVYSSRPHY